MVSQTVIAKKLNLSQRTVSLCLADSDRVAAATKKRVLEAAEQLGYRRNQSALAMRSGRFGVIGLLQCTQEQYSYLPPTILGSIQATLAKDKLNLMVSSFSTTDLNEDDRLPSVLREAMVDGLIVNYTHGFTPRFAEMVERSHLPSVWINVKRPYGCVYPNDVGAGRTMTEQLLQLGHRRIAYFCHRTYDSHFSVADRYQGYESAMSAAGLSPEKRVLEGDVSWEDVESGLQFVRSFLQGSRRPTAVVTYEAFEAMRVILAARELGLRVPADLSVVTFNERSSIGLGFPITTCHVPNGEMGRQAVEMLVARVKDRNAPLPQVAVDFTSVTGATTAKSPRD
jgi:DNA-binding LacI/PurR family transcriptional regulator